MLPTTFYGNQKQPLIFSVFPNVWSHVEFSLSRDKDGCTPFTYVWAPWCLLCSTLGFLGIMTHKYPHNIGLTYAYVGIFNRGTLVGVHPTIP